MSPEKKALIDRLEPEAAPLAQRLLDEELALMSIAVSLKRIADAADLAVRDKRIKAQIFGVGE